jgi:hypothetical protein
VGAMSLDILIGVVIGCITANLYRDRHAIIKWWKWGRHGVSVVEYNIEDADEATYKKEKESWIRFKRDNPYTVVLFNGVELK